MIRTFLAISVLGAMSVLAQDKPAEKVANAAPAPAKAAPVTPPTAEEREHFRTLRIEVGDMQTTLSGRELAAKAELDAVTKDRQEKLGPKFQELKALFDAFGPKCLPFTVDLTTGKCTETKAQTGNFQSGNLPPAAR